MGEARAEEFVNMLVRKLEQMGYSASSERGYVGWLEIENNSVADSYKEYKWWIYPEKEDGTLSEHNVDLYFAEDGIYIGGHVVEGVQNEEGFREILTDLSIENK